MTSRQRPAISAMASSHDIGVNSPAPLGPTRRSGVVTRSGECTRSAYSRTLPQITPCVKGCAGSPVTAVMRPSLTVTSRLQQEGQSCGHTECMRRF
jgi:hypothetical protein